MPRSKPYDFDIQFPTLLNSFEIANELEAELQKELLPIFAKAKKAYLKEFEKLKDLPPSISLYSPEAQKILDDASEAFKKAWSVPAFKVLSVYSKAGRNLGDITAEVLYANIAKQEGGK